MKLRKISAGASRRLKRAKDYLIKHPKKVLACALSGIIVLAIVADKAFPKDYLTVSQNVYVQVQSVKAENKADSSELTGTLEPIEEATVSFEVSGVLTVVNVRAGSEVKAGDVLAIVDGSAYDLGSQQAQGAAEQAQAALNQAKTAYRQTVTNLNRYEALYQAGAIAKSDYENAQTAMSAAEEQMRQAEAAYQQADAARLQAGLAVSKTALEAPLDGVVIAEYVSKSQLVSAGMPAYKIGNIDKFKISLLVPEAEIAAWQTGDPVSVKLGGEKLSGEAANIFPALNEGTGGVTVEVVVDNAGHKWYAGQVVACSHDRESGTAIYVPREAVISQGGQSAYVFLFKNGTAVKTGVTVGELKNNLFEIASGLKENDLVIVKGADRLSDGEKVKAIGSAVSD